MHATGRRGAGIDDETTGAVAAGVSAAVLAVGLGAMVLGAEWFWLAFAVGYGGVLPVAVGLARTRAPDAGRSGNGAREARADDEAGLATLRERYARGEVDEAEFERRVEVLLETGSLDGAADWARRRQ